MSGPGLSSGSCGDEPWTGGRWDEGTVCLLAPNPGPMTLDGTNTWVLAGQGSCVVVDPGPAHEGHLRAVLSAATHEGTGGSLTRLQVWLTHGHSDHSAGATRFAELAAGRLRRAVPIRALDPGLRLGAQGLVHGDRLDLGERSLLVEATPGHTSDSLSFVLDGGERRALLTGDTVLGRGTTVVAHPDGALAPYLASLRRLRDLTEGHAAAAVLPGHGPVLQDAHAVLGHYLRHRGQRLEAVRAAVADLDPHAGNDLVGAVVAKVYADVDRKLWPAARLSVAAQLEYLSGRGG